MTHFADWLSPATLRLLALALLHFLWQGAALAALAYALMALCRSAVARYAIAVAMLILMVSAPATTFLVLYAREKAEAPASTAEAVVISPGQAVSFAPRAALPRSIPREVTPAYFLWLVEAWFAGVMLLSLRSASGFLVVARLRRRESTPLNEELLDLCLSLQRRIGLTRVVRYCQCIHLDAPAVAGWVRPFVFLPMTALTGLNAAQLEAVIAHELAHIRRFDAFVNLFQIAVETLLFYHPAVWWLGKQIRAERENCCDDEAVALCGSPVNYAEACRAPSRCKRERRDFSPRESFRWRPVPVGRAARRQRIRWRCAQCSRAIARPGDHSIVCGNSVADSCACAQATSDTRSGYRRSCSCAERELCAGDESRAVATARSGPAA